MLKKISKYLKRTAFLVLFLSLGASTIRYYAIEGFRPSHEQNFKAPAEQIFSPKTDEFSFSVLSDAGSQTRPLEYIIKKIRHSKSQFILCLGDLIRYRNPAHFNWISEEVAEKLKGIPFYMVPGNHELAKSGNKLRLYTPVFGAPNYWFSYGNTLFIGLDSAQEKISLRQFRWLENTLKKHRDDYQNCILYSHVPPFAPNGEQHHHLDKSSQKRLEKIVKTYNINLLLFGHVHYYSQSTFAGVPMYTAPSSGQKIRSQDSRFGYLKIKIKKDSISVIPKYINKKGGSEYFELFASNALVKRSIHNFAIYSLLCGICLLVLSGILKIISLKSKKAS